MPLIKIECVDDGRSEFVNTDYVVRVVPTRSYGDAKESCDLVLGHGHGIVLLRVNESAASFVKRCNGGEEVQKNEEVSKRISENALELLRLEVEAKRARDQPHRPWGVIPGRPVYAPVFLNDPDFPMPGMPVNPVMPGWPNVTCAADTAAPPEKI